MADPRVKTESGQASLPKISRELMIAMANTALPEWKCCDGEPLLKQVLIKERAAKHGVKFLRDILSTLQNHRVTNRSCQPRIDKIDNIQGRRKEHTVMVGLLGSTGAGKTTLINALLGFNHLLPTSSHRAATAVPVEISYNKSNDPNAIFRAEIVFITVQDWKEELEQLFTDLDANQQGEDGDDDSVDDEREGRIKSTFDKVKCVYPNIRSREKLKSTTVEQLLADANVGHHFGTTKKISHAKRSRFSDMIKLFIDSGDSEGKSSALWPLVKMVKVFCISSLLENGIILVDLPGNMDSNAARTSVAENYYKELSVTCIVSNCSRGISENNAHDLLEKFTKRNLQLDGLLNAESLCFILSQTDLRFDVAQYIKDHPGLESFCEDDVKALKQHTRSIAELERQIKTTESSHSNYQKLVKSHSSKIRELTARLDRGSAERGHLEQKRKRIDDEPEEHAPSRASQDQMEMREQLAQLEKQRSDAQNLVRNGAGKLASFNRRTKNLEKAQFHARSRLYSTCIKNKNKLSTSAIRRDYEQTLHEMGREVTDPMQVFCCAATLYLKYLKSDKRLPGFPNKEDTQIRDLREWLISTTLKTRNSYAQAFLEDVDSFQASLKPWVNDTFADMKMTSDVREIVEPQADALLAELQEKFSKLTTENSNDLKELVVTTLYSKLQDAEKKAASKSKKTVDSWGGLHWSTHKSVNRGLGRWKDSHGRDHKWNDELALDLTDPLVKAWDQTFFVKLPAGFKTCSKKAQSLVSGFVAALEQVIVCSDVSDAIDMLRDHVLKSSSHLKQDSTSALDGVTKAIRKSHRRAIPAIREFLEPMYIQCASEKGRGHFARNRDLHKRTLRNGGVAMHLAGSEAIRLAIDQLLDEIPAKLALGYQAVLDQIKQELQQFFEQNSLNGTRSSGRKGVSATKVKLQRESAVHFEDLTTAWNSSAVPTKEPEIPDSEDELEDELDLFNPDQGGETESDYDDEL